MQDLKVTIIQSNLHWENIEGNLKMFSEKISSIKEETDLIVLPEMFSTGFTTKPETLRPEEKAEINVEFLTVTGPMIQLVKKHEVTIIEALKQ